MKKIALPVAILCLAAGVAAAAEPTIMHCFAFTPIKEATQADWDAFYKATDALPGKVKGIKRVWYGKLRAPLAQFNITDAAARKQALAEGKAAAAGDITATRREHGVCMEFENEAAWSAYGAKDNQAHNDWVNVYSKVRVAGTTTYQILPIK
jgi:hypothetical protein